MGFDCIYCGEREIWAFESRTRPRVCWECEERRFGETEYHREHRRRNNNGAGWVLVNAPTDENGQATNK